MRARQRRNRLLALRLKQPFRLQLRLELLERNLQRSRALRLEILRRNLQLAAVFIDRDPPPHHHLHPVCRAKPQQPRLGTEHHDADLRILVFQREIKMS